MQSYVVREETIQSYPMNLYCPSVNESGLYYRMLRPQIQEWASARNERMIGDRHTEIGRGPRN